MEKNGNQRTGLLYLVILILIMSFIAVRMIWLHSDKIRTEINYLDPVLSTTLVRGTIYDRNGKILAIQAPKYGFSIKDKSSRAAYLSSILSPYMNCSLLEAEELLRNGSGFIELRMIPTPSEINTIEKLISAIDATGEVEFSVQEERMYPFSAMTELIGSVDENMNGRSGLEEYADHILSPKPGLGYYAVYGSDIVTTLDISLQSAVENLDIVRTDEASQNITVAILSGNGEVLAWHGKPTPSLYQSLILSISSNGSSAVPYFPSFPTDEIRKEAEEADSDRNYLIYVKGTDDEKKETIANSLLSILRIQGRIRAQI